MKRYAVLMILLSLLAPAAMAATVTISPAKINPGDTVTVDVKDIPDNAKFSLSINAEFNANPGEGFNFEACDLTLPFSLKGASMNVYAEGVNEAAVSLEQKGKSYGALNNDDGDNIVKISQSPGDINDGVYDRFTLEGKAAAKKVITKMTVTGKKRGPNSGKITFTFEGDGSITPTIDVSIDESGKSETPSSSPGSPGGPSGPGDSSPPSDAPCHHLCGRQSLPHRDKHRGRKDPLKRSRRHTSHRLGHRRARLLHNSR